MSEAGGARFFLFLQKPKNMTQKTKKINKIKEKWQKHIAWNYVIVALSFFMYGCVFGVIVTIHTINERLDQINRQQIIFNQPNPYILQKSTDMMRGYPMEAMAPYIAQEDPQVAAFLIAIAKKESAWGKRAPKLHGQDCYNYWGFRQKRVRMGSGGHTCFDSPREAVRVVSARIEDLIDKKYDTPQKMIVWKCGFSCQDHSSMSIAKWVQDVDYYYDMMYQENF